MGIRIHPSGQGNRTDADRAIRLEELTPLSFRKAQDVLIAAEKYVSGPGFFKSRKSLIHSLQREVYGLKDALLSERYRADLSTSSVELLFSYLTDFSDAFPNWQREYAVLNDFIPECF